MKVMAEPFRQRFCRRLIRQQSDAVGAGPVLMADAS